MWSERRKRTQTRGGFINETIPYPIVAWMANKLIKNIIQGANKHE
jgi:hypothetical protein